MALVGESERTVTVLLQAWRQGDEAALGELMPIIYAQLHKLASSYMRGERPGHTMRPTELVAEAYMKLVEGAPPELNNRVHFLGIAARTMRQILVDHARAKAAAKRGAGERPVTLDEQVAAATSQPEHMLSLHAALEALAAFDERKARIIELHYFGGLSQPEIATALDVHVNTVGRDLKLAQAWLYRQMRSDAAT
jgi:RNA polymerase sigma-70 factor (ECF subfamily)